jgi:DNA-binding CsgD family transcriptional regulator
MIFESFESEMRSFSAACSWPATSVYAPSSSQVLPLLWSGLKDGRFRVDEQRTERDRVSLTIVHVGRRLGGGPSLERSASMCERVLLGASQKAVAVDNRAAPSTVAAAVKLVLERMGVFSRFMRVPLAIPLLAHAVHDPRGMSAFVDGNLPRSPGDECTVRIRRTDVTLADCLTVCELGVASALLEGNSYDQIARARGTSLRTVANQMCSVGRKLGTRGRFDLLLATVLRAREGLRRDHARSALVD